MGFIIGVDVGGTFTDAFAFEMESGRVFSAKALSTPQDPAGGVFSCLADLGEQAGVSLQDMLAATVKFAHGTTLTTNVLFTRSGAKLGLLATRGFADQILIMGGKGRVAGLSLFERRHFRATDKPEPLVPRRYIEEIGERIDYKGAVIVPLDPEEVSRAVDRLVDQGVEALAVAFLWSFRNDGHERRAEELARARHPKLFVTTSSQVAPVLGEYERTATAVVNAYVGPGVQEYLHTLEDRLAQNGLATPLLILQASGGVAEVKETLPVHTVESGPAAGVVGAKFLADLLGYPNVIATDVGGTTFKTAILRNGAWSLAREAVIGQYSIRIPMVDVASIGAGGGSIAWVDDSRLRVGPQSAGANPGPASYARGGTQPTVTDADLVLGYLNPDYFLGGRMPLRRDLAERALRSQVAERLFEGDVVRSARGVVDVIDAQMGDLIRKATIERGYDPRDFVVMAYGGAGPVHCGAYAAQLGIHTVIIPPEATVYSALGGAISDIRHSLQLSDPMFSPVDVERVRENFRRLERRALEALEREGVSGERIQLGWWVDVRYRRQMHEVRVPLYRGSAELTDEDIARLLEEFEARYARLYGTGAAYREAGYELVNFGLEAIGVIQKPILPRQERGGPDPEAARKGQRLIHWSALNRAVESVASPTYEGLRLRPGNRLEGPAVIEYPGTTVVVHPGQAASVDEYLNVILSL